MYYSVYGLVLKSDFTLPELHQISSELSEAGPDSIVEIVMGRVPEELNGEKSLSPWFGFAGRSSLYRIPDVGRILVEDGCRVTVDMQAGALESDMRTYLLGSGIGTIAHQRGLKPIHASVVLSPRGAIAFSGPSGAGKSTIVAELTKKLGWPVISDDLAMLSIQERQPMIVGGVKRLRLWSDALERLEWPKQGLERDTWRAEKFLSFQGAKFIGGFFPLTGLYEISPDRLEGVVVEMHGAEKFAAFLNAVYRPFLAPIYQNRQELNWAIALACERVVFWKGGRPSSNAMAGLVEQRVSCGAESTDAM